MNNFKRKIPAKSKFKMKWKTMQVTFIHYQKWLLTNRKDVIK